MIVSLLSGPNKYLFALEELDMLEELLGEKIYRCRDREDAFNCLPNADIVITLGSGNFSIDLDDALLEKCKNLKMVLSLNAGIEKLPIKKLLAKDIIISNAKGAHGGTIAEYVLGGMLAFSHSFNTYAHNQTDHRWAPSNPGEDIEGKTLCVIGTGSIGSVIGKKAKKLDMKVIGLKKHPCPIEYFDQVWGIDHLHEALAQSDYVVMVTPLTEETYHLIGEDEFKVMKNTAVLINVSRGDTVVESSLIDALKNKQIAGAVLDVFHDEPLSQTSELWSLNNVMITPHVAGPSRNTQRNAVNIIYEKIMKYRQGQEIKNRILS